MRKYSMQLARMPFLLLLLVTSCSRPSPPVQPALSKQAASTTPSVSEQRLTLSAAASTKEVVEALASQFTSKSNVPIDINLGPSSGLANQILAGAPADLFLSANQQWADEVQKGQQADSLVRLLTNRLALVVPESNPGSVNEPKDLLSSTVKKVALAGEKVPAGMYADQALTKLGLLERLNADGRIVRGQDVRSALSYVERGEAEAGIVYSTDVRSAKGLKVIHEFDSTLHDEIVYVLVLLKHGAKNPAAKEFFEFLRSNEADAVYSQFGFSRLP